MNMRAASNHRRFYARYSPNPTGPGAAQARAGKVIQVLIDRVTVRMTPDEARAFAQDLLTRAAKDPTCGLTLRWRSPGAAWARVAKVTQREIRVGVEAIYAALFLCGEGIA